MAGFHSIDLGRAVNTTSKYLKTALWCLIAVAIVEVISGVLWAFRLASFGVSILEAFAYAVLPILAISLIPTLVAIPLVYFISRSIIEKALRGNIEEISRLRKKMAILGGVTLLSLVVPGILLIIAFLKSEAIELALLSRRLPPYAPPPGPYPVR